MDNMNNKKPVECYEECLTCSKKRETCKDTSRCEGCPDDSQCIDCSPEKDHENGCQSCSLYMRSFENETPEQEFTYNPKTERFVLNEELKKHRPKNEYGD